MHKTFLLALLLLFSGSLSAATQPVEEIDWNMLIPEGFNPNAILDKYGDVDGMADDDPRVPEIMAELKRVMDEAPIEPKLDGKRVKLPGFVVPLEGDGDKIREFLLVPYFGACIHVPPPPSNQVVYVQVPKADAKIRRAFDTVWVIGTLSAKPFSHDLGEAGYRIEAEQVLPYE